MLKSLQAAVLGKADRDIPPYWRCRFTTTVLGNGRRLYCSCDLHGPDSACLSLSSSAMVADHTLVLQSLPLYSVLSQSLMRLTRGFLLHKAQTETYINTKKQGRWDKHKASCGMEKGSSVKRWWRREREQSGPEALETWVMASNLPGGSLVQSINGNSRKTAASLAHPGLGYALLEFDGLWQRLLCLAPAWTSLPFSLPSEHNGKGNAKEC